MAAKKSRISDRTKLEISGLAVFLTLAIIFSLQVTTGSGPSALSVTGFATNACPHDVCVQGDKLDKACGDCAAKICAADAYCCNTAWDSICVGEVQSICGQSCTTGGTVKPNVPALTINSGDYVGLYDYVVLYYGSAWTLKIKGATNSPAKLYCTAPSGKEACSGFTVCTTDGLGECSATGSTADGTEEGAWTEWVTINGVKSNYIKFGVKAAPTGNIPPSAPFNLQVTNPVEIDGTAKLTWQHGGGAEKFYVYSSKDGGTFTWLTDTTEKSYKDSGLNKIIKYGYHVTAVNNYGESGPSNIVYVYPAATKSILTAYINKKPYVLNEPFEISATAESDSVINFIFWYINPYCNFYGGSTANPSVEAANYVTSTIQVVCSATGQRNFSVTFKDAAGNKATDYVYISINNPAPATSSTGGGIVPGCSSNEQCLIGQICKDGKCVAGGSATPQCAHPICKQGDKLDKSCDACAAKVCASDAYCCNTAWDSICVGEVKSICGQNTCG